MMTNKVLAMGVIAAVLATGGAVQATLISYDAAGADFQTLSGSSIAPIESGFTDFSDHNLSAKVLYQVFTDGASYLYLYQVRNTGIAGNDTITRFTTSPFAQADGQTLLGYLNANVPAGFSPGDQAPVTDDIDSAAGPTVGFSFPPGIPRYGVPNFYIAPGKNSEVLYVQSNLPPGVVTGNIINGGVHSGQVVGPVPEPGTLVLLATAGLGLLAYAWRRRWPA